MPSAWAEFRRETFGDPFTVIHDGADFTRLRSRWLEQPALTGEMLRLGLSHDDSLAAQAVGYLAGSGADVSEFEDPLRSVLTRAQGTVRVQAAQALFALTRSQDCAEPICEVLTQRARRPRKLWTLVHSASKADAAIALNAFAPLPRVIRALAQGVQDGDYLVRRHSAQTLLVLAGRHTTIEQVPDLWVRIKDDNDREAHRQAAAELTRPWEA